MYKHIFIALILIFVSACSDEQQQTDNDGVLQNQIDALDKANQVEQVLSDAMKRRQEMMDSQ